MLLKDVADAHIKNYYMNLTLYDLKRIDEEENSCKLLSIATKEFRLSCNVKNRMDNLDIHFDI